MVPNNILQRTLHLRFAGSTGTGFTIDVDGRQYLCTARHVLENEEAGLRLKAGDTLDIQRDGQWYSIPVTDVWFSPSGADLALVSPAHQLTDSHPLVVEQGEFFLSQQIYFLGFPYGMHMELGRQMNEGLPMPFVKTGIVSSFSNIERGSQIIYCDGYNNPGFSGGPIVTMRDQRVTVIGVVSGYRYNEDEVLLDGKATGLIYKSNTGLVIGFNVRELVLRAKEAGTGGKLGVWGDS